MLADVLRKVIRTLASSVAAVGTTTSANGLGYPSGRKFDICQNGVKWIGVRSGTTLTLYYSLNGVSWVASSTFTLDSTSASFSFFIDKDDYAHLIITAVGEELIYQRGTPNAGRTLFTWTGGLFVDEAVYPDMVVHREGTGWMAHIVYDTGSTVRYKRITISSSGVLTLSSVIMEETGVIDMRHPSIDFHHIGDGKTVKDGLPHVFYTRSKGTSGPSNGTRFRKWAYSGGVWTPGTEVEISQTKFISSLAYWIVCRFDGTRVVLVGFVAKSTGGTAPVIFSRDVADTTTTESVLSDSIPAEYLLYGSAVINPVTGDIYFIGLNDIEAAGSNDIVYRKWTRAGGTLGAEVVLDVAVGATPYISAFPFLVNGRFEFVYVDDNASPYDIMFQGVAV